MVTSTFMPKETEAQVAHSTAAQIFSLTWLDKRPALESKLDWAWHGSQFRHKISYSLYEKQQLAQKSTEQELFEKAQKARLAELKTKKTSTKPTVESQPPLSKRDERAISHLLHRFETDIHTRHSTAKALSRVLNTPVEIYENDLAYPLIYKPAGTNLNKAVRLKYDSVFNQWSTVDMPYLRFDDIFEAAAATAKQHIDLQDLVAQEIRANPQLYLHAARDYLADFSYAKHHAESLAAFRVKTGAEDKWNEYAKSTNPATALRESFDKYVEDQLKSARRMQEPAPDVSVEDWLKHTAQHKVSKEYSMKQCVFGCHIKKMHLISALSDICAMIKSCLNKI